MNICKKCNCEFQSDYCPDCGHPSKVERINGRYVLTEIASVLNFQKGIFYTIKELLIRPGKNISLFISEDRKRLVNPITFILITSLIYTILVKIFHFEDGVIDGAKDALDNSGYATLAILKWVQGNYGYANIIMAIFIAFWFKIFFRKYPFNLFEILVLLCFIMGIEMLIYSAFGAVRGLTHIDIMQVGVLAGFIYATYAAGQFFGKRKIADYVKALVSYLLGMITFTIVLLVTGVLIDLNK
ncbi:MAG: DUF3667 domain-containing protein [Candidatus Atribacteria bacterium]|nr:DUF3667 domain-containing protein [Candidatus Atribacteria bacterium]